MDSFKNTDSLKKTVFTSVIWIIHSTDLFNNTDLFRVPNDTLHMHFRLVDLQWLSRTRVRHSKSS